MSERRGDGVHDAVSLARLALPEALAERLEASCRRTVEHWLTLRGAGPETVGPAHPAGIADVLRDDEPAPGLTTEDSLAAAADRDRGAFVVPRVADVS